MSAEDVKSKAYEEKISGQLQQAKSQLADFESRAKASMAQAEISAVNQLKAKRQEIEKKRQDLKTAAGAKAEQAKAEIDRDMVNLKSSLAQLETKLKKAG